MVGWLGTLQEVTARLKLLGKYQNDLPNLKGVSYAPWLLFATIERPEV